MKFFYVTLSDGFDRIVEQLVVKCDDMEVAVGILNAGSISEDDGRSVQYAAEIDEQHAIDLIEKEGLHFDDFTEGG